MLVLSRRPGEQVLIGKEIVVTVLEVRGGRVKLGFLGPEQVPINRKEIERKSAAPDDSKRRPGLVIASPGSDRSTLF